MVTVRVEQLLPLAPAAAFRLIADHATFLSGPPIRSCRVTRPGDDDPNGRGAVREVRALGLCFVEEIIDWDPPRSYAYRVREINVPAEHDHGRLTLTPSANGTRVVWQTHYRLTGRLGPLLTRLSMPVFGVLFGRVLRRAAARAAALS